MSIKLINGKVVNTKANAPPLDAPTPSQIAERAYEMATRVIVEYFEKTWDHDMESSVSSASVESVLDKAKAGVLAELRESVINPGVVPWWRNR